jgi:carbonic anhydrase
VEVCIHLPSQASQLHLPHKKKLQTRKPPPTIDTRTMSSEISTNALLARNKSYLPSHQPFPTIAELAPLGKLPHMLVVTCADGRCIPENFLGINPGEVIVIRNAGGNLQMALPNILALDTLLSFHEIMVVKHTDCGSLLYTNEGVKGVLMERVPGKKDEIENMEMGSIAGKTLEQGLKEQIRAVKANKLMREDLKPSIRCEMRSSRRTSVK